MLLLYGTALHCVAKYFDGLGMIGDCMISMTSKYMMRHVSIVCYAVEQELEAEEERLWQEQMQEARGRAEQERERYRRDRLVSYIPTDHHFCCQAHMA